MKMVCQKCGKALSACHAVGRTVNYAVPFVLCQECLEGDWRPELTSAFVRDCEDSGPAVLPGQIDMDGRVW